MCRRAGTDPRRHLLRVEEKRQVNAFALGGHVLAVTWVALELPDDMLEAVLAHEVGHHRHLHPWRSSSAGTCCRSRPATGCCGPSAGSPGGSDLRPAERPHRWAGRGSAPDGALGMLALLLALGVLVVAGGVLVIVLGLLRLPLSLLVRVAKVLSAALSRAGEHAADRHAAELGYGPGLVQVLLLFQQAEFAAPRPAAWPRCCAPIPPPRPASTQSAGPPTPPERTIGLHHRVSAIYR